MTTKFTLGTDLTSFKKNSDWKKQLKKLVSGSKYLDTSLVNGIRRYAISKINTLAFHYSKVPLDDDFIQFNYNNSGMNNDFIGHRIGLLYVKIIGVKLLLLLHRLEQTPGYFADILKLKDDDLINALNTKLKLRDNMNYISSFKFYIEEENDSEDIKNVTTELINLKEIEFDRTALSKYKIVINTYLEYIKQNHNIEIDIFSGDIKKELLKIIFPPYYDEELKKDYYILINKLKKHERLNCSFRLDLGNSELHARWSVVCPCTYKFIIDTNIVHEVLLNKLTKEKLLDDTIISNVEDEKREEVSLFLKERYKEEIKELHSFNLNEDIIKEYNDFIDGIDIENKEELKANITRKDKLLNNFNKCDLQRYYKGKQENDIFNRQFNFSIESVGFYNEERILYKAFKLLKNDLNSIISDILKLLDNKTDLPLITENITIDIGSKITNSIDITIKDGDHAIGNILSSYIYYLYNDDIEYVAHKIKHPLNNVLLLTIGYVYNDNMISKTIDLFKLLNDIFSKMELSTYIL